MSETVQMSVKQVDAMFARPNDEVRVLLAILTGVGAPVEIAKRANVPHAAVLPALRKLEADKLIERREGLWVAA